jgi:hypothetical protein
MNSPSTWWRRLLAGQGVAAGERTTGMPPSSNGVSSFYLRWHLDGRFDRVAVTLEVLDAPVVDRLYFWAIQTDFSDGGGRTAGGAHLGLQWHRPHPGSTAVNWGGYGDGGAELSGSHSALPSATGNPNTRDLQWSEAVPYRLEVARSPEPCPDGLTAWRGTVTDLVTGSIVVVRDLFTGGGKISAVTIWSEVFARCDDPTVTVRWSDPVAGPAGSSISPRSYSVNYQSHRDGGCANTDSSPDGTGVVQRTAVRRRTPQGAVLPIR